MYRLLIDTASIHHSSMAIGKRVDYHALVNHIITANNGPLEILIFADSKAKGFLKYLEESFKIDFPVQIITKEPRKKKIGRGNKIWYLSFAVDIAIQCIGCDTIITTDIEIDSILNHYKNITIYGIGIPKSLRDNAKQWYDVPEHCLQERLNDTA